MTAGPDEIAAAAAVVSGRPCVWVGSLFVEADRVAFKVRWSFECMVGDQVVAGAKNLSEGQRVAAPPPTTISNQPTNHSTTQPTNILGLP